MKFWSTDIIIIRIQEDVECLIVNYLTLTMLFWLFHILLFFFFQVEKNRVFSRLVLYQWDFLITIINEV